MRVGGYRHIDVLYKFEQRENLRFAKIPPFNGQQPAYFDLLSLEAR